MNCKNCGAEISVTKLLCPGCGCKNEVSLCGNKYDAKRKNGIFADGGSITFTDCGMLFHPHAFNLNTKDTFIAYSDICSVEKTTQLMIPTAIFVTVKGGTRHKFVVTKRDLIIDYLNAVIKEQS